MSNFEIIFISGVHGVGKSTFCSHIKEQYKLPFYTASSLIKEVKKSEVDFNKQVIDAENNQNDLIIALNNLHPQSETILLDGHFCLNGIDGIIDVDINTFKSMKLKLIITLYDSPQKIDDRLLERDDKSLGIDKINSLQKRELELAKITSDTLNISLCIISATDSLKDLTWIESFI
ncbi:AAA family ATPase [Methylovulum psychrotolerans]|uniref:ATP-binding protein n=1 Tax=Methylovulum psychrotolerans TaxID=1704499 RepID=UPI001BFFBC3A|nr:ATP-binding protein [Methylovulum psychrotolerans]MBT9097095.1 AAA family ATPase [Methylovulum psychrotolerans]